MPAAKKSTAVRRSSRLTGKGRYIGVSAASAKRRGIKKCRKGKVPCGRSCVSQGAKCHIIALVALPGKRTVTRRA